MKKKSCFWSSYEPKFWRSRIVHSPLGSFPYENWRPFNTCCHSSRGTTYFESSCVYRWLFAPWQGGQRKSFLPSPSLPALEQYTQTYCLGAANKNGLRRKRASSVDGLASNIRYLRHCFHPNGKGRNYFTIGLDSRIVLRISWPPVAKIFLKITTSIFSRASLLYVCPNPSNKLYTVICTTNQGRPIWHVDS